jgi:hypothetical protein
MEVLPNPYNPGTYKQYIPNLPKVDNKTGRVIACVVGGAVAIYIGYRIYLNINAKQAQKNAYDSEKPESYAQEIKLALDNNNWLGWGTDNNAIRQTLTRLPSKDFMRKVVNAYASLYKGKSMMADVASDLSTSEYQELLAIIEAKPQSGDQLRPQILTNQQYASWVKRIQASINANSFFVTYTDHAMLMKVLQEVPTKAALQTLKSVYRALTGRDLDQDLKDRVSWWYSDDVKAIIDSKK